MSQSDRPDPSERPTSSEVLIDAGVECGLIARLEELYPPSVLAMANLRRWSNAEAEGQKPMSDDIVVTEGQITAAFVDVYVADTLQAEQFDREFGSVGGHEAVLRVDEADRRTDTEIRSDGSAEDCIGSDQRRPLTAVMRILTLWSKSGTAFACFTQKRLCVSVGGPNRRRMIDLIKEDAIRMAEEKQTKTAVGAA